MAAYLFAKYTFWGSKGLFGMFLAGMMFPNFLVAVPLFLLMSEFGLLDTMIGLVLVYVSYSLSLTVFVLTGFFQRLPNELMEAAKIDGAGPWRTLWLVGLPMARNRLVVVFIVNFVTAWGEFLLCTTLTNDQTARTMPVVLAGAQGGLGQWAWPRLAAVYVIVVTPGLIAFTFAQRLFFKGLAEGVVKA